MGTYFLAGYCLARYWLRSDGALQMANIWTVGALFGLIIGGIPLIGPERVGSKLSPIMQN